MFRREQAPYDTARFRLHGLDPARKYVFTDLDDGRTFTVAGETLLTEGLCLTVSQPRKAKIYLYTSE